MAQGLLPVDGLIKLMGGSRPGGINRATEVAPLGSSAQNAHEKALREYRDIVAAMSASVTPGVFASQQIDAHRTGVEAMQAYHQAQLAREQARRSVDAQLRVENMELRRRIEALEKESKKKAGFQSELQEEIDEWLS